MHMFPVEGDKLTCCVLGSALLNKHPFLYLVHCFLHFCAFLLVILLFKMALKCSAEMLSSVPKY